MSIIKHTLLTLALLLMPIAATADIQFDADSLAHAEAVYRATLSGGCAIVRSNGDKAVCDSVIKVVPNISIDDPYLMQFITKKEAVEFINAFFLLRSLKMGDTYENAKDGLTDYALKVPNDNDYYKLRTIFGSRNNMLKEIYLDKVLGVFRIHGYTEGLKQIKRTIENSCPDTDKKKAVLEAYKRYQSISTGSPAPMSVLTDAAGNKVSLSQYTGKVVVIDVWATWCCACLEKLPLFRDLAARYADNDSVAFLTVSIDRRKSRDAYNKRVKELQLEGLDNYLADLEGGGSFEVDYALDGGIPRYIVIDVEGHIVSAFAPAVGRGLEEMIETTLQKAREGIQFRNISFEEALAQAKAEGKQVFVDCYIQTCGPCKWMAKNIFPQKACGDYFNPRFVSLKRDCDVGDGVDIRQRYNVQIYPTFLIINPDGTLYCKEIGAITRNSKITFVKKMQDALAVADMEAEFWAGRRDADFVAQLLPLIHEHNYERVSPIMAEYMKDFSVAQMAEPANWALIRQYTRKSHALYTVVVEHQKQLTSLLGADEVNAVVNQ